jgi:hypothetical protein
MSDPQFVSAMAVASALNTLSVVVGILINNSKLATLRANVADMHEQADQRFDPIDRRFDEMRDLSMTGLKRFENVSTARIKRLEERGALN